MIMELRLRGKYGKGKVALVDSEVYESIARYKWYVKPDGYVVRSTPRPNQKTVLLHREILGARKGQIVDHINHNKLDNRKANIKLGTSQDNNLNNPHAKGYSKHKKSGLWQAECRHKYLGLFNTESEARQAYLNARKAFDTERRMN